MGLTGKTNEEKIWNYLYSKIKNEYGVAGLIGNLRAESAFNPKNLQNTGNKKLGMTDEEYTQAVDNGTYTNFVRDGLGYSIAQHTYWSRKQNLLNYAKSKGVSIGDLEMQLDFLVTQELQIGYKDIWNKLINATSVRQASDVVLTEFERPADQSESMKVTRAKYGQESYDKFAKKTNNKEVDSMGYTNSSLVNYIKLSPNCSKPRKNKITKIVIHHMAGNLSVESCGNGFSNPARQASSNYGVGTDGRVGLYVEECNRAWTSSNATVDNQAVTIEVANDTVGGNWHVSDKALEKTIQLCVDICKRNGIKKLTFTGNKNGNLVAHRYYAATACPGEYLYSKFPYIAEEVNKRLGIKETTTNNNSSNSSFIHNGLDYSLVFNPTYYTNKYSDLKKAFGTDSKKLFDHFLNFGMKEGRQASADFNVQIYKNRYSDLQKAYGNNLKMYYLHYIQCGHKEKRKAI